MATSLKLIDYLDDLNNAVSAEDCMLATRRRVGDLGFENVVFIYTLKPQGPNGYLRPHLRYSSNSAAWEDRYRDMDYQNHCPIYRETLRGGTLPLVWQQVWERTEKSEIQRRMLDEAASFGVVHGVGIPIKERNGDRCSIGVSTALPGPEILKSIEANLPDLFLMAHHLHAVIVDRYVEQSPDDKTNPLTGRELDCLNWVSIGKSTWEFSEIYGISENTVKYHLRNIMTKLEVNSRGSRLSNGSAKFLEPSAAIATTIAGQTLHSLWQQPHHSDHDRLVRRPHRAGMCADLYRRCCC
jgi:DNA-binding CsgD family transcriptional regulator